MQITEEQLRTIVKESVHETLNGLGFTTNEPREQQADLIYIRKMRKGSEYVRYKVKASVITVLIPTIMYLLWEVVRGMFR